MKKNNVKKISLLVALFLLQFIGGCGAINLIFDGFFDPDDIVIDFEEGREIDLQFEVIASCTHDVGIGFRSKSPGSEMDRHNKVKEFFGDTFTLNLPAKIDILVVDNKNKTILEKSLEGKANHWIYGANPVKFIAEYVYLPAGIYHVKIKVNKCYKDFQEFEAFFFAKLDPKISC